MNRQWFLKQLVEKLIFGFVASFLLAISVFILERKNADYSHAAVSNEARIVIANSVFERYSNSIIETINLIQKYQNAEYVRDHEKGSPEQQLKEDVRKQKKIVIGLQSAFSSDDMFSKWISKCETFFDTGGVENINFPKDREFSDGLIENLGICLSDASRIVPQALRLEIKQSQEAINYYYYIIFSIFLIGMFALICVALPTSPPSDP